MVQKKEEDVNIYTLTTVYKNPEDHDAWGKTDSRCWGFYESLYQAEETAIRCADFFSEAGYYTHIIIEEVGPGICDFDSQRKPTWFELRKLDKDFEDANGYRHEFESVRVERPVWSKNIVGWGIG
jgi:hypothetical protein